MKRINTNALLLLILLCLGFSTIAQIAVNTDGSSPDASAMLDVKSTDMGVLLPRMTATEIANIVNPADGLLVYNTDDSRFYCFVNTEWKEMAIGAGIIAPTYCGFPITDTRDGKVYNTVLIGDQCWMAENLNVGNMISGGTNQTNNSTIEKYCYGDVTNNCDIYGGLYQWDEMMQYVTTEGAQGICPDGWHLPSDDEWKTLEMYLGMSQTEADKLDFRGTDEGGKLKEIGTTLWNSPNLGATNLSGFTAIPAGFRYPASSSTFYQIGNRDTFWTSSMSGPNSYQRIVYFDYQRVQRFNGTRTYGHSVRCLRD